MSYVTNIVLFAVLCVFPIQLSAHLGRGIGSLSIHLFCILLALLLWRIRPKLLGTKPEYIILIVCVTNVLGLVANVIT